MSFIGLLERGLERGSGRPSRDQSDGGNIHDEPQIMQLTYNYLFKYSIFNRAGKGNCTTDALNTRDERNSTQP
jgi:hypothetical protein